MPRALRLEFPGAIYHVFNRGEPGRQILSAAAAKDIFEACLFAACRRCGWRLHAFVILDDAYHLALETPWANLTRGMQWLQSTFANRAHRRGGSRVFRDRFRAPVIEPGEALGRICHLLHFLPAHTGAVPASALGAYRPSSYWYLARPAARPEFLATTALAAAGSLADDPEGWDAYARFLAEATGPAGPAREAIYRSLGRRRIVGSGRDQRALPSARISAAGGRGWAEGGDREARTRRWEAAFETCRAALPAEALSLPGPSAPWKIAVASHLKATTDVSNAWLCHRLAMGSPTYVSKLIGLHRRAPRPEVSRWQQQLETLQRGDAAAAVGTAATTDRFLIDFSAAERG